MVKKNKKEKSINIYELAGKAGKGVKKCSGYVLAVVGPLAIRGIVKIIKK